MRRARWGARWGLGREGGVDADEYRGATGRSYTTRSANTHTHTHIHTHIHTHTHIHSHIHIHTHTHTHIHTQPLTITLTYTQPLTQMQKHIHTIHSHIQIHGQRTHTANIRTCRRDRGVPPYEYVEPYHAPHCVLLHQPLPGRTHSGHSDAGLHRLRTEFIHTCYRGVKRVKYTGLPLFATQVNIIQEDGLYLVKTFKSTVELNKPIHIGACVLSNCRGWHGE